MREASVMRYFCGANSITCFQSYHNRLLITGITEPAVFLFGPVRIFERFQ